ncbi:hypothetical protein K469DRAFT_707788 [Zopfia rhizophila CBS 207.26]|uniref:Uncharacterized protein n=1 Tax=Zopfia rhizophila CBS 207.26 TaxID=1314779 RepID=A0A6A6E2Z2_9PEZI|nr:hypothetical protein K469DRAFT_707788 [Zopfia rhizophila CBS 207.26]
MNAFFDPLISKRATKSQRDELWDKMLDVCHRAFKLRIMMLRSKEGYTVQLLDVKEYPCYSKLEHFAEMLDVEGGKSVDASDEVAYYLFGALTKYAKHLGGDRKILVKAEAVLKSTPRG